MSITTRNPSNPNFLHPNKFQLNFARIPNVQYFCQSISIPGISLGEAVYNTPVLDMFLPGEKPTYDLLNVTFYVDEDLRSWIELHDWIKSITFPRNKANLARLNPNRAFKPEYSDAFVTLLTTSNNPNVVFKFYDVFPTNLSTFVMSATDSPDTIITADITLRFSYYDIVSANPAA